MAAYGLCIQCQEHDNLLGLGIKTTPDHCYGTADRVTPGVLGGFYCSCECRQWPKPTNQRRFSNLKENDDTVR